MKSTRLKFPFGSVGRCCCNADLSAALLLQILRQLIFPKSNPTFDGKFQIVWRAEQVEVVGHEQIITHEPRGGGVLPDVLQCALNRSLCQPAFALLGAYGEEYSVWSAERNMDALRRGAAAGFTEWDFAHGGLINARLADAKEF